MFKKKRVNADVAVGLDLDPSHIAAAEVTSTARSRSRAALSPTFVRASCATARSSTRSRSATSCKAFFAEHELPRRVRLGIANQRIVVRTLDLPPIDDPKALAAAVKHEAPDHIPMPMDEAVVDFQSLGLVDTAQGPRTRVVVVAVAPRDDRPPRRRRPRRRASSSRASTSSAFGMVRALRPAERDGAVLYVNAPGLTNIAVANASGCLFTRAAAGGLDAHGRDARRAPRADPEHARAVDARTSASHTPLEEVEGDPELVAATRAALEEGVHQLADTVRNSLNFYRMQESAETGRARRAHGSRHRHPRLRRAPGRAAQAAARAGAGGHGRRGRSTCGRLTVAAGLAVEHAR